MYKLINSDGMLRIAAYGKTYTICSTLCCDIQQDSKGRDSSRIILTVNPDSREYLSRELGITPRKIHKRVLSFINSTCIVSWSDGLLTMRRDGEFGVPDTDIAVIDYSGKIRL